MNKLTFNIYSKEVSHRGSFRITELLPLLKRSLRNDWSIANPRRSSSGTPLNTPITISSRTQCSTTSPEKLVKT